MKSKSLVFAFAALLAAGCSAQNPTVNGSLADNKGSIFSAAADGNGIVRKLDFDYVRAERLQALRKNDRSVLTTMAALPASADLRSSCSTVGDQGNLGACSAWAMGRGLREYMENKNHEKYTQLAPLYFYYKEREIAGSINEDSGSTITDGMTVLKDTGICAESDWPYDVAKFNVKPSAKAEGGASKFKVKSTVALNSLTEVKAQLAKGNAIAFGFKVYKSFMGKDVAKTGLMPLPKPGEQMMGGHAVLAVGYDEAKKVLIVRNSWGPAWGDKGYFYMPYAVVDKYSMDFWTAE
ncbi:MAG TPA: C1 family peptidase [Chroococcales cyanobacterium]|jgi:C1A family cysteine protease